MPSAAFFILYKWALLPRKKQARGMLLQKNAEIDIEPL
jgi:hypothetical protein